MKITFAEECDAQDLAAVLHMLSGSTVRIKYKHYGVLVTTHPVTLGKRTDAYTVTYGVNSEIDVTTIEEVEYQ